MKIDDLPLPNYIIEHIKRLGYSTLYPPQEIAVKKGLFTNKNMIVTTPTASGKTFIAVLATIHTLLNNEDGKVIYLVPLKALANEKYKEFKEFLSIPIKNRKIKISITTGDYDTPGERLRDSDIIIATNERLDSILRHAPSWLKDIKLIIADEAHLIGISDRGPVLESLLTRFKIEFRDVRILVLSATIKNKDDFKRWLDADIIYSEWRPVPLREGVIYNHIEVYSDYNENEIPKITGDPILDNSIATVREGGQVIIFTQTRREAVSKAKKYSEFMEGRREYFTEDEIRLLKETSKKIMTTGEITEISKLLSKLILTGVAFHHAGLNPMHREIIEDTFRRGAIKILTATPTLAAGVNLPSRKVIITYTSRRGLGGFLEDISVFEYKQMAGRAGRPQYDKYGVALLYSKYENMVDILLDTFINNEPEPLLSHLLEGEELESQLLGLATTYRVVDSRKIYNFLSNTLCSIQHGEKRVIIKGKRALKTLLDEDLLEYDEKKDLFKPTRLGQRAAVLYIYPSTAAHFRNIAVENRGRYVKPDPLILLYYICKTKDMGIVPVRKKDRDRIINELETNYTHIIEEYVQHISEPISILYDEIELSSWKTAFVLKEWIEEKSEDEILKEWGVEPGDLYILRTNAEWLSYSAREICRLYNNRIFYNEYSKLMLRVKYGVKEELLPLVEIKGVGRRRARTLYTHGYRRLSDFKKASLEELVSIPGIGLETAKKILHQAKTTTSQ
jgi:helicase